MLDKEGLQELLDVIRELKEPAGTILMLRYLYCFNIPEIADRMDMKRSQVDNYLSRGRKRLLEKLNGNLQRNRRRDHNGGY
jgi:RNA polymerase sigma factor (sigma-70 family)